MHRYRSHFVWLGVCVLTWFAERSVYLPDAPAAGGKTPKAGLVAKSPAPGPGGTASGAGADTPGTAMSSSLAADFDFPADWEAKQCVKEALGELNEYRRMQMFQRAMQRLTRESAATIQEVFSGYDKTGRWFPAEYGFFLRRWGEIDGETAANFALNRGSGDQQGWTGLLQRTLAGWAVNDPEGAVKWLNNKEGVNEWVMNASINGMIEGLVEKDPARAVAFALSQADENGRTSFFSTLTDSLIYGPGIQRAEEWMNRIPAEGDMAESKRRVFSQIVDRQLRGGPDEAAELALRYAGEPWIDNASVQRIARHLGRKDPEKLQTWLNALPEGPLRESAAGAWKPQ